MLFRSEGKAQLYDQERQRASATGNAHKSLQAQIAVRCWATYAKNLTTLKGELEAAIQNALAGYKDKQKRIWWLYFIEDKSVYEIEEAMHLNVRNVSRALASMKADMELKFRVPRPLTQEGRATPKWGARELANFLEENPSEEYVKAVSELLEYGIIDIDALEFDEMFQEFLEKGRH